MKLGRLLTWLTLTAVPAAGCGGSSGAAAADPAGEAKGPFSKWDRDTKMEYMASTVLPQMTELFQSYDSSGFETFECATCHGEDFQAVDYEMPNALHALPEADPISAAKEYDAKVTQFMVDEVVPKMSSLLNEPANCFTCHQKE